MDQMKTTHEVAEILQVSVRTLARWRTLGKGPRWSSIGGRYRYTIDAIEEYQDLTESVRADNGGTLEAWKHEAQCADKAATRLKQENIRLRAQLDLALKRLERIHKASAADAPIKDFSPPIGYALCDSEPDPADPSMHKVEIALVKP